jgi:hypothetical protein
MVYIFIYSIVVLINPHGLKFTPGFFFILFLNPCLFSVRAKPYVRDIQCIVKLSKVTAKTLKHWPVLCKQIRAERRNLN